MRDVTLLKEALPYLRRHRRRTMVVKLGGEIAANAGALALARAGDLPPRAREHPHRRRARRRARRPRDLSRRLGLEPKLVQGRRVTDEATLARREDGLRGQHQPRHPRRAAAARACTPWGSSGVDGDILHAVRRPPTPMRDDATGETRLVDFGHVGDVTDVDTSLLSLLVENGYVPVVSSLGADAEGNVLNINADTVASVLARDLQAAKLIS